MKLKPALILLGLISFSSSFGQIKFESLGIDTSITGFHFAANFQGTQVYTKNGASDISTINPTAFSFTLAPKMSSSSAKHELTNLLNMSKQNGYTISGLVEKDTTLGINIAYYISYTETHGSDYKNVVFNAFVIKNNTAVVFTSGDLENGQYVDKFKKTFYSIKL